MREYVILKVYIFVLSVLLLIGCSSKKDVNILNIYKENVIYHKQLKHTEKIQLYENNTSKALLTATYLNVPNIDNNESEDEVFIVGVDLEDALSSSVAQKGYSLTLNGLFPKEVIPLSKADSRLKALSFVTEWGSYYLVTFAHSKEKSFYLVFENKAYGQGRLHFSKVAKYVLDIDTTIPRTTF